MKENTTLKRVSYLVNGLERVPVLLKFPVDQRWWRHVELSQTYGPIKEGAFFADVFLHIQPVLNVTHTPHGQLLIHSESPSSYFISLSLCLSLITLHTYTLTLSLTLTLTPSLSLPTLKRISNTYIKSRKGSLVCQFVQLTLTSLWRHDVFLNGGIFASGWGLMYD